MHLLHTDTQQKHTSIDKKRGKKESEEKRQPSVVSACLSVTATRSSGLEAATGSGMDYGNQTWRVYTELKAP